MVNRDNYLLIKSHLKYLEQVEQLSPASLRRYWFQLRRLLIWADGTPLSRSPEIRPTFPVYVTALSGRRGEPSLAVCIPGPLASLISSRRSHVLPIM